MIFEICSIFFKISNGLFKFVFQGVEIILGSRFFICKFFKRCLNIFIKLLKHASDSTDRSSIKEHIKFRGSHLGEKSYDWGVMVREIDSDTSSEKHAGMGGELGQRGILNYQIVQNTNSAFHDVQSISMIFGSFQEKLMGFISSLSSSLQSGSGVTDILVSLF